MENIFNNGIFNLPNVSPTEKLVLLQISTLKGLGVDRVNVTTSSKQLGFTRNGWQKIAKRLIVKGYLLNPKRGYYELPNLNVF